MAFWASGGCCGCRPAVAPGTDGLGLGDAKLFGAAGAWLGWQMLPHVLLAASLAGLVAAGLLRRRRIAFGPWIAAGFFGVWLWRTYLP